MNNLEEEQIIEVENQYWVDQNTALERLEKNPDFQAVILTGYFKDKAINGVSLLANDQIVKEGHRPAIMESLVAISQLEDHFHTIKNLGTVVPEDEEEAQTEFLQGQGE